MHNKRQREEERRNRQKLAAAVSTHAIEQAVERIAAPEKSHAIATQLPQPEIPLTITSSPRNPSVAVGHGIVPGNGSGHVSCGERGKNGGRKRSILRKDRTNVVTDDGALSKGAEGRKKSVIFQDDDPASSASVEWNPPAQALRRKFVLSEGDSYPTKEQQRRAFGVKGGNDDEDRVVIDGSTTGNGEDYGATNGGQNGEILAAERRSSQR